MRPFLLVLIFFLCSCVAYSSELQERLKAPTTVTKTGADPAATLNMSEAVKKIRQAIETQKKMSPTMEAEYFYQAKTDDSPCVHCPEYLRLIREVNHVVEKMPKSGESVAVHNESLVQLNRLRFLYYETRVTEENGNQGCNMYMNGELLKREGLPSESMVLLAEEALSLPNVTSVHYYPRGKEKEIHYFYQGEGEQENVIVEVIVSADKKALVRYHYYRPLKDHDYAEGLPELGPEPSPSSIKAMGSHDPTQMKVNVKKDVALSEDLNLSTESRLRLEDQSTKVKLNDAEGKNWVTIDAVHKNQKVTLKTVIPVEWNIDESSGLKVDGEVFHEDIGSYVDGTISGKTRVVFGLTDHNHEYLRTTVIADSEAERLIRLSSRYSIGKYGTIRGEAEALGRDETYSVSHNLVKSGSSFTTKLGVSKKDGKYFELQKETRIGDEASMILMLKASENDETFVMYQYKKSLR